ncbi:MAG: aminotransferase class I/II-fold pyridoxal phosphate-dependent enzyme [Erysipelotrichaceae bacterium]|nr:aminotransferase class I/II-fold pyridoxal phosphate-dependent enzyme [Erysipelotrichaceae bacterium]
MVNNYEESTNKIIEFAKKDKSELKIDGTIGVLVNENGRLNEIKLINKFIKKNLNYKTKGYGDILGDKEFNEFIIKWIFSKNYKEMISSFSFGATSALSFLFSKYCLNKRLLVPSLRWRNYDLIAKENNIKLKEYNFFDQNKFNINGLKSLIEKESLINDEINVLINDPCHNPTGYSLSACEWEEIFSFILKTSLKSKINLILDIAYIDYSKYRLQNLFDIINKVNENINVFFTFSFSKSFGLYGYRGGACILYSLSTKEREDFIKRMKLYCRSTFSSCNTLLTSTFKNIYFNKENIKKRIKDNIYLLKKRARILIKMLDSEDIDYYPYEEGFFLLIKCFDSISICEALIKEHVYLLPCKNGIRVSIGSIPIDKIGPLVKKLKICLLKNSKISVN